MVVGFDDGSDKITGELKCRATCQEKNDSWSLADVMIVVTGISWIPILSLIRKHVATFIADSRDSFGPKWFALVIYPNISGKLSIRGFIQQYIHVSIWTVSKSWYGYSKRKGI